MITITTKGKYSKLNKYLNKLKEFDRDRILNKYGSKGIKALEKYTPKDTGVTAESWYYEIVNKEGRYSIIFGNKNVVDEVPIAIILQYGHVSQNGTWVEGKDYINPAIKPVFEKMADELWEEVNKL